MLEIDASSPAGGKVIQCRLYIDQETLDDILALLVDEPVTLSDWIRAAIRARIREQGL